MNDTEIVEIRNTNYYMLINKVSNKALHLNAQSRSIESEKVNLEQVNQSNLGQIWMLVQVAPDRFPNKYEIVHTISTLALTSQKQSMYVRTGKWKGTQLYFLQRYNPQSSPNQFLIREDKQSNRYLANEDGAVRMKQCSSLNQNFIWKISLVYGNPIINRSCYIEYAYSNMVLDVPKASDKPGIVICQYPCNNRFNQRWNLKKVGEYYQIENLKTGMCLDIKGQSKKPNTPIIQWKSTGSNNQLWRIEYQGKNIYMIRSAMDESLYMGVRDNSLKQCADIVTTHNSEQCFWRIVGYIP